MIKFENVNKRFGKLQALNNIQIHCKQGESIALLGPNGCGKTTLIKSILNMVVPDSGSIEILGVKVSGDCSYRQKIGYMPQIGRYPENMTVKQVMDTILSLRANEESKDLSLYESFKIGEILDKRMGTLSGGTRQKVSAVLAFLFNPDILILDEPTAGLDPLAAEILKVKMIQKRNEGKLILITSHLLSELEDVVSQVIFMQDGSIQLHESKTDIIQRSGEKSLAKAIAKILFTENQTKSGEGQA